MNSAQIARNRPHVPQSVSRTAIPAPMARRRRKLGVVGDGLMPGMTGAVLALVMLATSLGPLTGEVLLVTYFWCPRQDSNLLPAD